MGAIKIDPNIIMNVQKYSEYYGIPKTFLYALIQTESDFNQYAQKYEATYKWTYQIKEMANELSEKYKVTVKPQDMFMWQINSYGICQIMAACAYEYGFRDWPGKLFEIGTNLNYACMHIINRQKVNKIGDINTYYLDMYACYNAGTLRKKKRNPDEYENQDNVNRFNKHMQFFIENYNQI